MRKADGTMDTMSAMGTTAWHIPRPSLSGSSGGGSAAGDARARGSSSSSQGSASNHSTHSVSSGSLLLSAAHLARAHGAAAAATSPAPDPAAPGDARTVYSANLTSYVGSQHDAVRQHRKLQRTDAVQVAIPEEAADPFWSGVKRGGAGGAAADADAGSVASSTHFTVVNGFTRTRAGKPDDTPWCCNSSHQVTVLVITMTILFSACILAAICFVEMRLRKESDYRFS